MKKLFLVLLFFILIPQVVALTESLEIGEYTVTYSYDENDVEAGESFNIKVILTNDGENKSDIRFEFEEDFPFKFKDEDDLKISLLGEEESRSASFRIEVDEDARSQEYELEFRLEDEDDDYDDEIDIKVDSNQPELIIGDVRSVPLIITPDRDNIQLTITVQNIGGGDANFVRARLELPEGFTSSNSYSDISNLGSIGESEGKEAIFFIDTAKVLDSGAFEADLILEYEDPNDNNKASRLKFDLPVKGRPQFIVSDFEVSPGEVPIGTDDAEVRITITNIGFEEGKETSVRVFESSDIPFEFNEKTRTIGSLKNGESGTGVFTFNVDSNAKTNDYIVKIQIRTVSEGNVYISDETISIEIRESERGNLGVIISLIVLIILVIILIFSVTKLRSRK
ncbi:hypothetical protein GF386_02335 [Candidatus Pacearchaeota archaeon]|nr:hypothetical protein [Candidatus Pacearchaeota archaeon]MBD3282996.1 hypothetical protein [Candidatus Pacearchaeota archaeon]